MGLFHKKEESEEQRLDRDVEKKIKKYPRFMRKRLRELYKDYKAGKLILPEGYKKEDYLDKD